MGSPSFTERLARKTRRRFSCCTDCPLRHECSSRCSPGSVGKLASLLLLSGLLLITFALTMTLALGVKAPLSLSLFSAAGRALLLGARGKFPLSLDELLQRNPTIFRAASPDNLAETVAANPMRIAEFPPAKNAPLPTPALASIFRCSPQAPPGRRGVARKAERECSGP